MNCGRCTLLLGDQSDKSIAFVSLARHFKGKTYYLIIIARIQVSTSTSSDAYNVHNDQKTRTSSSIVYIVAPLYYIQECRYQKGKLNDDGMYE